MERKEPVIDSRAVDLKDRVKLTWRDVKALADESASAAASAVRIPEQPALVVSPTNAESTDQPVRFTQAERAAIAAQLAPSVETAVKHALRETLDLALQNALARVRGDIERSVTGLVSDAVTRELDKLDLEKIIRR